MVVLVMVVLVAVWVAITLSKEETLIGAAVAAAVLVVMDLREAILFMAVAVAAVLAQMLLRLAVQAHLVAMAAQLFQIVLEQQHLVLCRVAVVAHLKAAQVAQALQVKLFLLGGNYGC
jgi:hypothetical protein